MKVAYLLFAYKNPKLIRRLIDTLTTEDCAFFIHIDKKKDLTDFASVKGENAFFVEDRLLVHWSEFSGVQAILALLRQAFIAAAAYDYFILLSGSEYPLRSGRYIHRFLESNRGAEFMSIVKVPNTAAGKPMSRITNLRIPSDRPVLRFMVKVLTRLNLVSRDYRKYLGTLEPYSGNTWWGLSRNACGYLLDFVERNDSVVGFFEKTFTPEESFFHTILGNSAFISRMRRNLVYEDWSARGAHPEMINEQHIAFFEAHQIVNMDDVYGLGEVLFARKCCDENLEVVNRIDNMIKRKEAGSSL